MSRDATIAERRQFVKRAKLPRLRSPVDAFMPLTIPFVGILKLFALGSVKTVLLLLGALIIPRWTLLFMIRAAAGIVLPVGGWLLERGKVDSGTVDSVRREIDVMLEVNYTRAQAREILLGLAKATMTSIVSGTLDAGRRGARFFTRIVDACLGR
ncbi:MAG: hypothetical protein K0U93_00960 [Gammaproteobacteria bacterium]|nr:hypothetical protein [Gammaproteobacteria bacterium]